QEGPYERNRGTKFEPFGRDDFAAVPRAATGPRARAGSVRAHTGVRSLPHAAARARARVASADARYAGRQRTAPFAAGAIPGSRAPLDAMDLGTGFWTCGNRRVRALHRIHSTLADTIGAGRIQRNELAGPADFPEPFLERMATHDHSIRVPRARDA